MQILLKDLLFQHSIWKKFKLPVWNIIAKIRLVKKFVKVLEAGILFWILLSFLKFEIRVDTNLIFFFLFLEHNEGKIRIYGSEKWNKLIWNVWEILNSLDVIFL
jgi:hypothetical protein